MVRGDIGDAGNLIPLLAPGKPSHDTAGYGFWGELKKPFKQKK